MSTRYMKKVYGTNVIPEKDSENESEVENLATNSMKAKTFNVFDMLNENCESNDKEAEENNSADELNSDDAKRKKRKKRKRKVGNHIKTERTIDEEGERVDEVERSVREVNKLLGEPVPSCSSQNSYNSQCVVQKCKEDVLTVQHKHLNPYNELKRIFGSKTVQAEKRSNRSRGNHLKRTWMVLPKKHWSPVTKSWLYMMLDNTMEPSGDVQYFMFEHSPSYRQVQQKFIEAVESLDPHNIADILKDHLYHVDALLQVAELCKLNGDWLSAAEVTERALYSLECAFHPLFNVTTARCRMDYRKQQNRGFFITLFKHLSMVAGRACYRTSLEICKLLLSLDPEGDPLAIVLSIDFYALRAKKYEWFVEFVNLWDSTRNLLQLPNIAYSLALAHFHLGNQSLADELLQNALIMSPGVLIPLLDKCNIQTDEKVTQHEFFTRKAAITTSPALEKLQALYIARSFHLWKEADILPWLKQAVHSVLDRVDAKDEYVKYCAVKRSKRYRGKLPRNIMRHIVLSDIKDVTVNIQEVQNEGLLLSYDPLPPIDSIDIYKTPTARTRTVASSSNILSLFFSSLFTHLNGDVAVAGLDGLNLFHDNNEQA